jgi:hypothetical protein
VTARPQTPLEPRREPPTVEPVPAWIGPLFLVLALGTAPWTVYLAMSLPKHALNSNYRNAWVGFDIGLILLLLLTAVLAYMGSWHVTMAATATATALVIDAWFDVVTAPHTNDLIVAVLTAILGELPLAALCLWTALHADRMAARRLRQLARRAERRSAK